MARQRKYYIVPDGSRVIWASQLAAEYRDGASVHKLAVKYGTCDQTIRNALNRFLESSGRGQRRAGAPSAFDKRREKMAEMRRNGMTLKQIGNEFGVTRERIRQHLLKFAEDHNEPELIGPREREPHHRCPNCGGPVYDPKAINCSVECSKAATAKRNAPLVRRVFSLRRDGYTWVQCAKAVGWNHSKSGTGLTNFVKAHPLYAELSAEDHDLIFPHAKSNRYKAAFADAAAAD